MGIIDFFKKAGGWVKDKFHKVVNAVGTGYKFLQPIVSKGLSLAQMVPGKIGMLAGAGRGILDAAGGVINALPSGGIKDKLSNLAQRGNDFIDKTQGKSQQLWNQVQDKIDTGQRIYDAGAKAVGQVSGMADRLRNGS
jgi:hypothetical protein